MEGNMLLGLTENIQTWDKLERRITELPTEMQRGNAFAGFPRIALLGRFFVTLSWNIIRQGTPTNAGHAGRNDRGC